MDKNDLIRIVSGCLRAARHDHPGQSDAEIAPSIAKRIAGELFPKLEGWGSSDLSEDQYKFAFADAPASEAPRARPSSGGSNPPSPKTEGEGTPSPAPTTPKGEA